MEVAYSAKALEDIAYWKKSGNKNTRKNCCFKSKILNTILLPALAKPEPLKYELAGKWSRRIDKENRVIYVVKNNTLYVYSLKGHY